MDDFILALGWVGVYAPLALGAVGSMVGVSRGGMAACGALLEVESGYGRFIGVSAMPSSQTSACTDSRRPSMAKKALDFRR